MQPPIPLGTILQNRYRIVEILGQGGFGRTYLAEDQGRFNELCAIKELIPAASENYAWEKSQELFQREASILYQIQHPQVPQFRATFEQDQRLFLVQDYVAGKTYQTLINERRSHGLTFSATEVLQLIRQLLPVLAHLHSRGIIHRDISPDNIILRESDAKPVLIDFGVVKELATRLQSLNRVSQPTTVGKFGYAPSEQIQTGRAYANSDLYALAVTAIVLLTGKEPQELYDDNQLQWNWQDFVSVSPGLAQVLNRMLSYKPSDRYQSVAQVAQALDQYTNPQLPTINRQPAAEVSQVRTVAVGRSPDPVATSSSTKRSQPAIPAPKTRLWDNPGAIAALAILVAVTAGLGSWALVNFIIGNRTPPESQTFPSPLVTETPTPLESPTPPPSEEPTSYSQNINLPVGETASLTGSLKANTAINYTFTGEQGQQLNTSVLAESGAVLLSVLGPNQAPLEESAEQVNQYQGILPFTGTYTVQLTPIEEEVDNAYRLELRLDNPAELPPTSAAPPDLPAADTTSPPNVVVPTDNAEIISFEPGKTAQRVAGRTSPQQPQSYIVDVPPGQRLVVTAERGVVTLAMRDPSGQPVTSGCSYLVCNVAAPQGGTYQILVNANDKKPTKFLLDVRLRN